MNDIPSDPPKPLRLPRNHGDTIEERAEVEWDSQLYDNIHEIPPIPEAFVTQFKASRHHRDYMAGKTTGSIEYDDAKRHRDKAEKAMAVLVEIAKQDRYKWRDQREKSPEEIQAWVDEEIKAQEKKLRLAQERARKRQEGTAAERESLDSPVEATETEEEARERQADRVGVHLGEALRRHPKVVPLRREERMGREERVEDREDKRPEPRKVIIDLITDEELYAKHFDPLVFLVKNMMAEGTLNILAGKPKIGKSFLALQIGRAVGAGLDLWPDCPCTKVPVLYLGLEDTPRRLKHRMIGQLGMGVRPKGGVHFATLWPRIGKEGEDGIAAIEDVVERFGIRLVIIDTWARFRALSANGRGGTAYIQDYDDLAPLVDFCKRTGVAILLIHHTKKGESANIFDMISGSVGLQGAVDCEMVLTGNQIKDAEGGSAAVLSGSARDFEGFELELEFEPVPCTWKYVGKAAVVRASDEKEAVLAALREFGGEASSTAVRGITGKSVEATRQMLNRMVRDKLLERVRPGVFRVRE